MKKLLCAITVLLFFSRGAMAQGSVQLYGVVDTGVSYNSNAGAGSVVRVSSGNLSGSRFGLRGKEDLGQGLTASFVLESGYAVDTGTQLQGSRLFGRQAYIGLSHDKAGALFLGRQYPVFAFPVGGDTAGLRYGTTIMIHPLDLDFTSGSMRVNNAITYESPKFGGFAMRGQYAMGEAPGDPANNRAWSVGASYESGYTRVNAGYTELDNPASSNANGAASGDYLAVLPLWVRQFDANSAGRASPSSATVGVGKQRTGAFSIVHERDAWSVGLVSTYTQLQSLAIANAANTQINTTSGSLKQAVLELNATYRFTPNSLTGIMASYTKADFSVPAGSYAPVWWHFGIGHDYFFSKRTDLYAAFGYQKANGANNIAVMGQSIASGRIQFATTVGLRHKF